MITLIFVTFIIALIYKFFFKCSKNETKQNDRFKNQINSNNFELPISSDLDYFIDVGESNDFFKRILNNGLHFIHSDEIYYVITQNDVNLAVPELTKEITLFFDMIIQLGKESKDKLKISFPDASEYELKIRSLLWGWEILSKSLNAIRQNQKNTELHDKIISMDIVDHITEIKYPNFNDFKETDYSTLNTHLERTVNSVKEWVVTHNLVKTR